jgi:hypothetical protein
VGATVFGTVPTGSDEASYTHRPENDSENGRTPILFDTILVGWDRGEANVSEKRKYLPSRRPTRKRHPLRGACIQRATSPMLFFGAGDHILVGHRLGHDIS